MWIAAPLLFALGLPAPLAAQDEYPSISRGSVRTRLVESSGLEFPYHEKVDVAAYRAEAALHRTVDNGWFVDFPDILLKLQGRTASVEESVGLLTDLTNQNRAGAKAADGHYYLNCVSGPRCDLTPISADELKAALGGVPRPAAMNPCRAVRITNPTAAVLGYLSASQNPAAYAWDKPDGGKRTVTETVVGMLAEFSEPITHKTFRACLTSGSDDTMQSCARAGVRMAMIDRVQRSGAPLELPKASPAEALFEQAMRYAQGDRVPENRYTAMGYLDKACGLGLKDACNYATESRKVQTHMQNAIDIYDQFYTYFNQQRNESCLKENGFSEWNKHRVAGKSAYYEGRFSDALEILKEAEQPLKKLDKLC